MGYKGEIPATHYGTDSVALDRGPGVVYWIKPTISTGQGTIRLRDGPSSNADILITIEKSANADAVQRFDPPLPYEKGLYVDVVDHIQDFTIAYDHLE